MKNIYYFFLTLLSLSFLQSCREDGDWENHVQFRLTVDRDYQFSEKGTGEAQSLKFNLKTQYNFNALPTKFKFDNTLSGVLKLNNKILNPNQEYTFTKSENIFEYVGNAPGEHQLKITVFNEKKFSIQEDFLLKYGVSSFTHTYTGGITETYQGDSSQYTMKIVPGNNQPTTGYEIRFNNYSGNIKYNGAHASLGQFYPINNLDEFNVILNTTIAGQQKLDYTIRNSTTSKDYEIQHEVKQRQISFENIQINSTSAPINSNLNITGIIKKSPNNTNTSIKYKTWISSASNNNNSGIQTTNNTFVPYALGNNGAFNFNFETLEIGNYTLNIQAQDEFGNETEIKSFNIIVNTPMTINGIPNLIFTIYKADSNSHYVGQVKINDLNATANYNNKISKIEVKLKFRSIASNKWFDKTFTYTQNPNETNLNHHSEKTIYGFKDSSAYISHGDWSGQDNLNAEITVYDNQGQKTTVNPSVNGYWYADYNYSVQ